MKRTILISLMSGLAVAPALAKDEFQVKLGGRIDTQAGVIHEGGNYRNTQPAKNGLNKLRSSGIVNDSRIDINVDAVSAKGFKYGGNMRLFGNTSAAINKSPYTGDQNKIYIESDKIGRFEFGNTPGAPDLLELDIDNFGVGTYGVNGYWATWLNDRSYKLDNVLPSGISAQYNDVQSFQFIDIPVLPTNYSSNGYSNAPKVNFFTKPIAEVTLGFSFTPDMDSRGTIAGMSNENSRAEGDQRAGPATYKNITGFGITIDKKFGDYGAKVNFSGVHGQAKNKALDTMNAYEVGTMLNYKTFKISTTYGDWRNTGTLKVNNTPGRKRVAKYWSAGFGQEMDKFGYSVTYFNSRKAGGLEAVTLTDLVGVGATAAAMTDTSANTLENVVLDVDYAIAKGFKAYAAYSDFKFKESGGQKDKGNLILVGTRLLF